MDNSFGTWIRRRRKALDLTRQELAQRVGCSVSLIFKIEADERRPSSQIAELLAQYLDVPTDHRQLFLKVARQEKGIQNLDSMPPLTVPQPGSVPSQTQSDLPIPLTSLIGREHELRMIAQQIQNPGCHLLTLTGPGGVGKTRLALESAHHLRDVFPHGTYFVPLVGTSSSEFIVPAIADALAFVFSGANQPKQQLINFLKEKQILLVLDNLEHLLVGIELLNELLEHAPNVKLLVTSREQLSLRAEWVIEIQGLPVPSNIEPNNLESNSATALFLQRAKQAKTDFTLTEADLPSVNRICQLVEGLPLGLELAATWVRLMSLKEIVLEIERSIDFLTTTARDVPQRHRSIRAVFDHSWNLLTEDEQGILRHLAVFSGGFTREAAEYVASASVSKLSALIDKSLLRLTGVHTGWYDFHELIRQYVEFKARENAEENIQLHERHASYYAVWLHQLESQLQGPLQQETLSRISLNIDNVRSAWNRMVKFHQTSNLQQSLETVFVFHDIRNWLHQGAALFEQAVSAWLPFEKVDDEGDPDRILLGELMVCHGHMVWHLGQSQKARQLLQRSLKLLGSHRNRPMLAEAVLYLSLLEHSQGNYAAARNYAEECVSLNQGMGRDFGTGYALSNLGMVCLTEGRHETAYECLKESVAVMRSINHPRGTAINLSRLGLAALRLGKLDEAQKSLEESLETTRKLHDSWGTGNALNYLGWLALKQGNLENAESVVRESVKLAEADGDQILLAWTLTDMGLILHERNANPGVREVFLRALQVALDSQNTPAALYALVGIAKVDAETGSAERALQLAWYSLGHPSSNYQTKSGAEKLCIKLEAQLTSKQIEAARLRAQSMTLDAMVRELDSS